MNKKAFTLVELIVVITILAVLATVAFISFQGYAVSSRDSARLSDIASMQKVLELYNVKNSKYPNPDNGTNITYSGSVAWTQGVFGTSAYSDGSSMSNVPLDPITGLEYPYSRTVTGKEYSIATILEQPVSSKVTNNTFAGTQEAEVYVKGNYNGKFLKVRANSTTYLLGVPSILASDITSIDLVQILNNKKLVYNGFKNLPASFSGSIYNTNPTNGFNFTPAQLILFEGNTQDLVNNQSDRVTFLSSLQTNYTGSPIVSEASIAEVLAIDSTSAAASSNYVATVLNNTLKTNIPVVAVTIASTDWRTQDPNCDIPDIVVGTQTWAGCNSTIGTGVEYTNDNSCYSYDGLIFSLGGCSAGLFGDSIDKEIDWYSTPNANGDIGVNNIWGKLYTWDNAQNACGVGYHLPSDAEWTTLEDYLIMNNGSTYIGWKGNSLLNSTNNLIKALQIPLSGIFSAATYSFTSRGSDASLWSSSAGNASASYKIRSINWNDLNVNSNTDITFSALSVRCVKD